MVPSWSKRNEFYGLIPFGAFITNLYLGIVLIGNKYSLNLDLSEITLGEVSI